MEPTSYGCLLVPIIQSKIPYELNLHLSRKFDSKRGVWEIDNIMKELCSELEARGRCDTDTQESHGKDMNTIDPLMTHHVTRFVKQIILQTSVES